MEWVIDCPCLMLWGLKLFWEFNVGVILFYEISIFLFVLICVIRDLVIWFCLILFKISNSPRNLIWRWFYSMKSLTRFLLTSRYFCYTIRYIKNISVRGVVLNLRPKGRVYWLYLLFVFWLVSCFVCLLIWMSQTLMRIL